MFSVDLRTGISTSGTSSRLAEEQTFLLEKLKKCDTDVIFNLTFSSTYIWLCALGRGGAQGRGAFKDCVGD